jgi:hypothetical protein
MRSARHSVHRRGDALDQLGQSGDGDRMDVRMDLPVHLLERARDQDGVVSRAQLLTAGVTPAQVRWQLGRAWRLLLPGVVLLSPGLATVQQRQMAALLYAGSDSWLSGPTALVLHGWSSPRSGRRVHVLVPPSRRSRDVAWLSIRRSWITDERVVERGPVRFSCLPRAVVDAAAQSPSDAECRALLIDAVQRRLVRLDDISHWIDARRPNGKARLHRALAEAAAGSWSVPEADLAALLSRSSVLPTAWLNPELRDADGHRLTTPDLWFDDVAMAVMVHSREFHAGILDWEATVDRDSDLSACRVVVVGVTPGAIARDPAGVRRRIEDVYEKAAGSGHRADVVATPRIVAMGKALLSPEFHEARYVGS